MNFAGHIWSLAGFSTLVISGVGILHLRPWAWWLALCYVVFNLVHTVLFLGYEIGMVLPAMDALARNPRVDSHDFGVDLVAFVSVMRFFHVVAVVFLSLIGLYPLFVVSILFLPSTSQAFDPQTDDSTEKWARLRETSAGSEEDYSDIEERWHGRDDRFDDDARRKFGQR